jgi:hypothetical protein
MDHQPAVVSREQVPPCGIFDNLRFIAQLSLGIKAQFRAGVGLNATKIARG